MAKQSAPELLAEFMEANRGDYRSFGVYMVPEGDPVAEEARDDAGYWTSTLGWEFMRNCDAVVVGLDDHLLIIKDRYRETPYRIFGENLQSS